MINFFRNIRRQLANENKFQRYMRYAIGEVILIMLGIFMALQLQNWNERRKQANQFNETLNKVYTSINTNMEIFNAYRHKLLKDFVLIDAFIHASDSTDFLGNSQIYLTEDSLINKNLYYFNQKLIEQEVDSLKNWQKPHLLFFLEHFPENLTSSELTYYNDFLNPDPNSKQQNELTQKIVKLNTKLSFTTFSSSKRITDYLIEQGIPRPTTMHANGPYYNWKLLNPSAYTTEEISLVNQIIDTDYFNSLLRDLATNKVDESADLMTLYQEGKNVLKSIKEYNPEITLNYPNLGIIGDALNGWNVPSTPMVQTSTESCIWEITVTLKEGRLKFRSDDSWINNWGGTIFPKGYTLYWGGDIAVKAGKYHVILNLTENSYQFIKQED